MGSLASGVRQRSNSDGPVGPSAPSPCDQRGLPLALGIPRIRAPMSALTKALGCLRINFNNKLAHTKKRAEERDCSNSGEDPFVGRWRCKPRCEYKSKGYTGALDEGRKPVLLIAAIPAARKLVTGMGEATFTCFWSPSLLMPSHWQSGSRRGLIAGGPQCRREKNARDQLTYYSCVLP